MKIFKKKKKFFAIGALVLVLSAVTLVSFTDRDFKIVKSLDIYYTLFRELNMYYVDKTDPEKLVKTSIDGMLSSLDPYTTYIPESEMDNFKFMTTGQYGGIGALIRKSDDYAVISEPYESFPAQKAGLQAGDIVLKIDGVSTKGKALDKVSELLKGTPNTPVELLIKRPYAEQKEKKFTVTREKITINNVPYYGMVSDSIGYIRLSNFTSDAGRDVKNALIDLEQNMNAKSVILDLRGNPGGLLVEAVNVANVFVPEGQEIVSTKGKVKQWDAVYRTTNSPVDTKIPLVVLVNRGSASASEIVTGSMQDLDRGVIVGERTFGKGLVQTTRPLSYNAQLKVTTAKYYIPSGRCIQALDYSHRNPDGSVGHIPDSLITAFKTENGRTVYDGGGIKPDIHIAPDQLSNITVSLYAKNFMFNYATLFHSQHDTIAPPTKFNLSDSQYNDFISFLQGKNFDYQTSSEAELQDLIKTAKQEKYYQLARPEFDSLKVKLAHDKNKDLRTFQPEIKELLDEEIVSRYYYQKGKIKCSLRDDPQLDGAMGVLKNPEKYRAILQPGYNLNDTLEAAR